MKEHINPDQSERLIKAGLKIDTADMYYRDGQYYEGKPNMSSLAVVAPIWSLNALRAIMPTFINVDVDGSKIDFRLGYYTEEDGDHTLCYVDTLWKIFQHVVFKSKELAETATLMVLWLLDKEYIKKGGENELHQQ